MKKYIALLKSKGLNLPHNEIKSLVKISIDEYNYMISRTRIPCSVLTKVKGRFTRESIEQMRALELLSNI